MGLVETIARQLCREAGKEPDELCAVMTCGGPREIPRWIHEFGFAATQAVQTVAIHLQSNDPRRRHLSAVPVLAKAVEQARV